MTAHRVFHMKQTTLFLTATLLGQALVSGESVTVDSQADWEKAIASSTGVAVENGTVSPMGKTGQLKTKLKRFDRKRSALSLTIRQSAVWQNWNPIENLGFRSDSSSAKPQIAESSATGRTAFGRIASAWS